eukprot:jgi/Tetstr1/463805/TSEL_008620.t1
MVLVEDGELPRASGRLFSKSMGDLSDPTILDQLRYKHPSHGHPIPDAAFDVPRLMFDEAALAVEMRVSYQQLTQAARGGGAFTRMRNEYLRYLVDEYAPALGHAAVRRIMSEFGIGTSAGCSSTVSASLIAEKLDMRDVTVHTNLRDAYNEFNTMRTCIADVEAALREAPADIEWPELVATTASRSSICRSDR